jgi:methionyl-tRNA formyltransferase
MISVPPAIETIQPLAPPLDRARRSGDIAYNLTGPWRGLAVGTVVGGLGPTAAAGSGSDGAATSRRPRRASPSGTLETTARAHPRILFVGTVLEGRRCLEALIEAGERPVAIVTLDAALAPLTSGWVPFDDIAASLGVPLLAVRDLNTEENVELVTALRPDLILVIGWTRLLGQAVLRLPPLGAVGFHASLLPKYRGRAPINWAIINGERETGNTMFFLEEGVDRGDIIDQHRIPIEDDDDCATLYEKVAVAAIEMLLAHLPALKAGRAPRSPQDELTATVMPRRRPEDGRIEWGRDARSLFNWVRALTHPYPGAFTHYDGRRLFIWRAMEGNPSTDAPPGRLVEGADGSMHVATGSGTLRLTSVQWAEEVEVDARMLRPLVGLTFEPEDVR